VVLGQQSTVAWMLGPSELLALFFLSIALFYMAKIYLINDSLINKIIFIVFILLSSLSKESFILIIPSIYFLYVWRISEQKNISFINAFKIEFISFVLSGEIPVLCVPVSTLIKKFTLLFSFSYTFLYKSFGGMT